MPDNSLNQAVFQPMSKEQLQAEVDKLVTRFRISKGEELVQAVGDLWTTPDSIRRYLAEGEEYRRIYYPRLLASDPPIEAMEQTQIRFLALYSFSDYELNKVLETIPEYRAREDGFKNLVHKVQLTEEVLMRYLELCKHFYFSAWWKARWEDLISESNRGSVLRYHAYVEPEGTFAEESVEHFREELMTCTYNNLQHVIAGLEEGEKKLIELINVNPNMTEA